MRDVDIQWMPKISRVTQLVNKGLEYALVSHDYKQVHQFVYCKDFLQDCVHARLNNLSLSIYGFTYNNQSNPLVCLDETKIMVCDCRKKSFSKLIPNVLDMINQIEDHLGMKKSTARFCKNLPGDYKKAGVWLFEGSKRWMKAAPMLSFYTLLLRLGLNHPIGDHFDKTLVDLYNMDRPCYRKKDREALVASWPAIRWILDYGDRKLFYNEMKQNYPRKLDVYDMHNNCGLIGYSEKSGHNFSLSKAMPYWYRLPGA